MLACGVFLAAAVLTSFRLSEAIDINHDEATYAIASVAFLRTGLTRWDGTPFFVHPPLFFVLEGSYFKLRGIGSSQLFDRLAGDVPIVSGEALLPPGASVSDDNLFNGVVAGRYLSVGYSALLAVATFWLVSRFASLPLGLCAAVLWMIDPYSARRDHFNMLEPLTTVWGVLAFSVYGRLLQVPPGKRQGLLVLLGILLGLGLLSKELALMYLLGLLVHTVVFRPHSRMENRARTRSTGTESRAPLMPSVEGSGRDSTLSGVMAGDALPLVVRLLTNAGRTGDLIVSRESWCAELRFLRGQLVSSRIVFPHGQAALGLLLDDLHDGELRFRFAGPPENTSTMRGVLTGRALMPLVRSLSRASNSGDLLLSCDSWSAQLHIAQGQVLASVVQSEDGQAALRLLLGILGSGEFALTFMEVQARLTSHPADIGTGRQVPTLQLACRVKDAWGASKAGFRQLALPFGIATAMYLVFPIWAAASGNLAAWWTAKTWLLQRLLGIIQDTGMTRPGSTLGTSVASTYVDYWPSFVVLSLSGLFACSVVYFSARGIRDPHGEQLAAFVLACSGFFLIVWRIGGVLNEQFFYLLMPFSVMMVAYSPQILVRLLRLYDGRLNGFRQRLPAYMRRGLLIVLLSLAVCDSILWVGRYVMSRDDSFAQVEGFAARIVPPGEPIVGRDGLDYYLLPKNPIFGVSIWESSQSFEAREIIDRRIPYAIVNDKALFERYQGTNVPYYNWVTDNGHLVYEFQGRLWNTYVFHFNY